VEHWLITLIRQAQEKNPEIPGILSARDDGGPGRADAIYNSLPQHAQGAWDKLGVDKQLLALSGPEEIALFVAEKLPPAPGAPVPRRPGQPTIFVSETPRGFRHRSFEKSGPAFCGASPAGTNKWEFAFEEESSLVSRNCEACKAADPNAKEAPH
jgi:hypothetical protein